MPEHSKDHKKEPYKDPDEFIKNLGAEAFEEQQSQVREMYSCTVWKSWRKTMI